MIHPTSRYHGVEIASATLADGGVAAYLRRRFLPRGDALPVLVEITATPGLRIDLITARSLGDPEQYWRVCDANDAMNPVTLTVRPGRSLRVPIPQAGDR
jgi:hypothetical protein